MAGADDTGSKQRLELSRRRAMFRRGVRYVDLDQLQARVFLTTFRVHLRVVSMRAVRVAIVDPYEEALNRFEQLIQTAKKTEVRAPLTMTLATADHRCRPSVRTVVVKHFDRRGFVFLTHCGSRKGVQLAENPFAALCFYFQPLLEQVTIEGPVGVVESEETDGYWAGRARDAQFAAWASRQSEPLDHRTTLTKRLSEFQKQFADQRVPRPSEWIGYRIVPERIEFWRAGWRHLHERVCYTKTPAGWRVELLCP